MNRFELQQLRDLPIEGVAERLGLRVERHKCLCPFHDDHHASLTFSQSRNTFRCWACGESGDNISLVMKLLPSRGGREGSFKEACQWLGLTPTAPSCSPFGGVSKQETSSPSEHSPKGGAGRGLAFYERFFEHPFLNEEARHFLFEERKLDERVVRWCRLTSWRDKQGIPWLQIPYYNREGKLIGIQNRNLTAPSKPPQREAYGHSPLGNCPLAAEQLGSASDGGQKQERGIRFRFPRGSQCGIYNLPVLNLLKPGDELYIAEGCSDCWSLLSAGHKAIAIPSATLLTQPLVEQLNELSSSPRGEAGRGLSFHMFPDRDLPGERLFLQLQKVLPNLVHHQLPQGCKDFSDYYIQMVNGKSSNGK